MNGILYLVATPIGNLGDMTFRAVEVLKAVDLIAAEDTRHSGLLLKHFAIEKPLMSYHDHSGSGKRDRILEALQDGKHVALLSDAGTPLVNDPGYKLVREVIAAGIDVTALPGPSAVINALVLSGLEPDQFTYLGYFPQKASKRKMTIERIVAENRTVIFFESPFRVEKTLQELLEGLGDRRVAICREMTKKFETIFRGSLNEALGHVKEKGARGEYTIVLGIKDESHEEDHEEQENQP